MKRNWALLTDLYQLTMAAAYWKNGLHNRNAAFHLFYRKNPFQGDYAIACGLEFVIDYLKNFKFEVNDIQYLASLKGADNYPLFSEAFLNYLQRMEFSCDVDAVPEGTMVFPHQPLLRIKGPLIQAQLIETFLLNTINFSTLIATKASRICKAAAGDDVLEFGLRRAQGMDGGLSASRAAYVGGCVATSNVLAGQQFGIPVKGTHAHSWVMTFDEELESFEAYAKAQPNNAIFLVDTYNTIEGIKNAINVGFKLRKNGHEMLGIRLDSGDLCALSISARIMLDEAGFPNAKVVASNDLDEYEITRLKKAGAKIEVWGVGTRLSTAYDQPALGGVYKLAAIENDNGVWEDRVKLSEQAIKVSNPGMQTVQRVFANGLPKADVITAVNETLSSSISYFDFNTNASNTIEGDEVRNILLSIFEAGKCVYNNPSTSSIRDYAIQQLDLFSKVALKNYPQGLSKNLQEKKMKLISNHQKKVQLK